MSRAERADALAKLPREGEVLDLDDAQQAKLAAARRVLALHGRDDVYVVKVIELPQAALALYARAVVLLSRPALDILEPEELQAVVAHEIGHEYFWDEYAEARRRNDRVALRRLELRCDRVALLTLRDAGIAPERLTAALEKIGRYNRDRFGAALNEDEYPTLAERRRFAKRIADEPGIP